MQVWWLFLFWELDIESRERCTSQRTSSFEMKPSQIPSKNPLEAKHSRLVSINRWYSRRSYLPMQLQILGTTHRYPLGSAWQTRRSLQESPQRLQ